MFELVTGSDIQSLDVKRYGPPTPKVLLRLKRRLAANLPQVSQAVPQVIAVCTLQLCALTCPATCRTLSSSSQRVGPRHRSMRSPTIHGARRRRRRSPTQCQHLTVRNSPLSGRVKGGLKFHFALLCNSSIVLTPDERSQVAVSSCIIFSRAT